MTPADNVLISVALTTYNSARYLDKQIRSILAQSHRNIEIIAVDDNSTDSTVEMLESYARHSRLVIFRNESRQGCYRSFERAIRNCNGNYIALCDHDDIWLENKLEKLLAAIDGYALACSDACLIDEDDKIIHDSFLSYSGTQVVEGCRFIRLLYYPTLLGCTTLITRELGEQALPFPEGEHYHDWWLSIVATKGRGIKYLREKLVMYRQHTANHTGAARNNPLSSLLFRCISTRQKNISTTYSRMMQERLMGIKSHPLFSAADIAAIDDAITYFTSKIDSTFHPRCVPIALKYRDELFANYDKNFRFILALASCF
jgi:glycosyltransferase involved in cell wall biosynthesis